MKVIISFPNGRWYGPYHDEEEARRTADFFEERGQATLTFTVPDGMTWEEFRDTIERIIREVKSKEVAGSR
jgi:hypothetical protein